MGKLRKFMIALCIATGISCLAGAAACAANEPEYYVLTAEGAGVDIVFIDNMEGFNNGGKVKEGVNVRFKIEVGANATGEPAVKVNDELLLPDAEGVYSFTMSAATVIKVDNISTLSTLTFDKSQKTTDSSGAEYKTVLRMTYTDLEGKTLYSGMVDGEAKDEDVVMEYDVKAVNGEPFSFKINLSPYYVQEFDVSYNTEVLLPDENGVYTIEAVDGNATIAVTGVKQEDSFIQRGDGDGTEDNPFLLKRPIDLFNMAALVNSSFYAGYNAAHYKLAADIDMKGEQLYVSGDASNSTAIFSGTFDGDGHTISNFYITDEVVDQETYAEEYLPYVGLFGYVAATMTSPAVIKDVTLSDYEVLTHPGAAGAGVYVGSVVGFGIGVEISGCKLVNGTVSSEGDDNQMICMGGVAGVLQAAYSNAGGSLITYDSFIYGCGTDIEVIGSGSPRSTGGIAGYLVSSDINAIAYVSDCYSLGDVNGGMHVGGIVGTLGLLSSVYNCYATGEIIANNYLSMQGLNDAYKGAYAGGIVGYAETDTLISNCYSGVSNTYAQSSNGASWQATGDIVAKAAGAGEVSITSAGLISLNCLTSTTAANDDTFRNVLGWSEREWAFNGGYPTLNALSDGAENKITVTVKAGDTLVLTADNTVGAGYRTIYKWYNDGVLDEYIVNTADGLRSWGYYFDKALTQKVTSGYVPTRDVTLYVGFADYSEITGKYYIDAIGAVSDDTVGDGRISDFKAGSAYVVFNDDGTADFRYGGMTYTSPYTYDGETITLLYSAVLSTIFTDTRTEGSLFSFTGTVDGRTLTLKTLASLVQSTSGETTTYGYVNVTVEAIKEENLGVYGRYYGTNRTIYCFAGDGNGTSTTSAGTISEFTFSVSDDGTVTSTLGNITLGADGAITKIGNTSVTKLDEFYGTWKRNANAVYSVAFDGRGTVNYLGESVQYTVSDGVATFTAGGKQHTAQFEGGLLSVDGVTYSDGAGYTGKWFYSGVDEQITLTLDGIGESGYGEAIISYLGGVVTDVAAQYDVTKSGSLTYIRIYVGNVLYGELSIADGAAQKIISGSFFSLLNDAYYTSTSFYLYDNFEGTWASGVEEFDSITFNGKGAYNVAATGETFAISGSVTARTAGGTTTKGTYSLTSATAGTMNMGGKTYSIAYDELEDTFTMTAADDGKIKFARRDMWYGVELYDGDGLSYTFDGKGYIGGTLTVSDGSEYGYTVTDGVTVLSDGRTLAANGQTFDLGGTQLSLRTGFAGEWIANGNRPVTITEADSNFNAKLTFDGKEYIFTYNPQTGTLVRSGEGKLDAATVKLLGSYEMSITALFDGDDAYINCIKWSEADGWAGEFKAADGSSYTFDGLGRATYGQGTVIYKNGNTLTTYSYTVDKFGTPSIKADVTKVFVRVDGEGGYSADGYEERFDFVEPNSYQGRYAYVDGGEAEYYFDGGSTLYVSTDGGKTYAKAYSYEVVSETEVRLTSGNSVKKGTLTKSGNYYTIEITDAE